MRTFRTLLIALLAAGLLLPGCSKSGGGGASTPQALFDDLKGKNPENFSEIVNYIAPDELPFMSFSMDVMAAFMTGFSKDKTLKTKYEAIRKKYKLPDVDKKMAMKMNDTDAVMKYAAEKYANVDHAAFLKEIQGLVQKNKATAKKEKKEKVFAELKDVKITGDTATGIVVDKNKKEDKISFKKVNGKWYLSLKDMMKRR